MGVKKQFCTNNVIPKELKPGKSQQGIQSVLKKLRKLDNWTKKEVTRLKSRCQEAILKKGNKKIRLKYAK